MSNELETRLRERAESLGVTVESLATNLLASGVAEPGTPRNGSELVESWRTQGLIGYRSDISDAAKHATKLRKSATKRAR